MAKLIRPTVTTALIALSAAGCGSSGASGSASTQKVSATAYVTALCRAVAPFERDVASRSSALNRSTSTTLGADKAKLVSYLSAVSQDTDSALAKLKAAGVPEVRDGVTISSEIIDAFERVGSGLSRSATMADKLPTTSNVAFQGAAGKLVPTIKSSLGQLGTGFSKTDENKQLKAAAARVAACHTL